MTSSLQNKSLLDYYGVVHLFAVHTELLKRHGHYIVQTLGDEAQGKVLDICNRLNMRTGRRAPTECALGDWTNPTWVNARSTNSATKTMSGSENSLHENAF